ncbi:hypothetical protein FHS61_001974 [Altererythrobacter atlanticus]|uniref:Uncharacterized protein n=1 Tax=Croceibacterium atlanticum TaxID=1267766 RepID=A0A0F7KQV8_9SPHN|nr:hypothetical protein [Croceibacterium atlanticum]AKH41486.1 hypothetical protein WYH_00427 [Croceibacterium atlanticum]MBB5732948.1 hypothetical protein [Croceibacterium atlanticum]
MSEAKRQEIKEKIDAAEARNQNRYEATFLERAGERAIETKDKFTAFAKEHPVTVIAGGLAAGVLVSALFRRSPTRKLARKGFSEASGLAAIGAEIALAYAQQAMSTADEARRVGADKLGDLGDTIGDKARRMKRDAAYMAEEAGDNARMAKRNTRKAIARAIRNRLH